MNKKLAMKWVKALRSGEYKQGTGKLNDGQGNFCCLGVLCEIEGLPKETINGDDIAYNGSRGVYTGKSLKSSVGRIKDGPALVDLNDGPNDDIDQLTFDEIADIIQICYEEL